MKKLEENSKNTGVRLNKFLASKTGFSRREADDFIKDGRVVINGEKIKDLATFVAPKDIVEFDGKILANTEVSPVYIMLNKPQGYISAVKSEEGFKTVIELIKNETALHKHIFPVGRLDFMSEGLLLLTNDGDFAYKVTHPKFSIIKTYLVEAKGELTEELFKRIKKGVYIEDSGLLKPHGIKIIGRSMHKFLLMVELTHGKNREIRRLMEFFNLKILMLKRVSIGGLDMENLPSGHYRILNKKVAELAFKVKSTEEKREEKDSKDSVKDKLEKRLLRNKSVSEAKKLSKAIKFEKSVGVSKTAKSPKFISPKFISPKSLKPAKSSK